MKKLLLIFVTLASVSNFANAKERMMSDEANLTPGQVVRTIIRAAKPSVAHAPEGHSPCPVRPAPRPRPPITSKL